MQVYCFHLMPWVSADDFSQTHKTAWVTCPNTLYDPEWVHPLYNRYLDELSSPINSARRVCVQRAPSNRLRRNALADIHGSLPGTTHKAGKVGHLGNYCRSTITTASSGRIAMLDVFTKGRVVSHGRGHRQGILFL